MQPYDLSWKYNLQSQLENAAHLPNWPKNKNPGKIKFWQRYEATGIAICCWQEYKLAQFGKTIQY